MSKNVVVIGGGVSGKHAAQEISKAKDVKVTLVMANQFVEWPIAMTKVFAFPELHYKALSEKPDLFQIPSATYRYGAVTSVDPAKKTVVLSDQTSLSYDALVVATGFGMPLFYPELGATLQERKSQVAQIGASIKAAACVAIVGGGIVAVELAGDIRVAHPSKKIVLLVRDQVLKPYPDNVRKEVAAALENQRIEVRTGEFADVPRDPVFEAGTCSVGGQSVAYDVLIPAYSRGPNTSFLAGVTGMLDEQGAITVNDHLQSPAFPEVFAVGVSNRKEGFVGIAKLEGQWKTVGANVSALLAGKKELKKHSEGMPGMKRPPVIPIGRGAGGWAMFDCSQVPAPISCCCCGGLGGFPCCPLPLCWPCCHPCACGMCCGPPAGEGTAKCLSGFEFKTASFHYKGMGSEAPRQQQM